MKKIDIEKKVYEAIVGSVDLDAFSTATYGFAPKIRRILDLSIENNDIVSPMIVVACFSKTSDKNVYVFEVSVTVEVVRDLTAIGTVETSSIVEEERENIDIISDIIQNDVKLALRGTSSGINIKSEFYIPQGEESLFELMLFEIEIKKCITSL